MMFTRVTLTLDEFVIRKLKEKSPENLSAYVNNCLKQNLFVYKESMAGVLKGKVSTKDILRDVEHEI